MNQIIFSQAGVSEGAKPPDTPAFLFYLDKRSEQSCGANKKGTGLIMGNSRWGASPERRKYSSQTVQAEQPVCTRSEICIGCPFPSTGFICWGDSGDCMKTRLEKMKENEKHDQIDNDTT